ncbi:MAG: DUF2207 domain-containing protein, partial [Nocardioides sp.]
MRRILGYLAGIAVIAGILSSPALFWDVVGSEQVDATDEPTSISNYDVTYAVDPDGTMAVTEKIAVEVSTIDRHGIYRFWDRIDPNVSSARRMPHDISVTRDGRSEPFTTEYQNLRRFYVAKIGDEDTTLSLGTHTYTISYTMNNVIIPGADLDGVEEPSAFFWDVVPGGWQQDMTDVDLTVALPVRTPRTVGCAVGWDAVEGCSVRGAGTKTLTLHLDRLSARTPVTVRTGLAMATPVASRNLVQTDSLPWSGRWDYVLGDSRAAVWVVVILGVAGAVAGGLLGARTRERKPGFPLTYAPPDGMGPAQAAFVLNETVGTREYVATLMSAAATGAISLQRFGDAWQVTNLDPAKVAELDEVSRGVVGALVPVPGSTFVARHRGVESGKTLKASMDSFTSSTKRWAISSGHLAKLMLGSVGGLLVIGALVLIGVCLFFNPTGFTMAGLIPGAFAVFGASMVATGAGTVRTRVGRTLWSQIGGFQRVLSTPSSKDRFEFSGRTELYTTFIPWAVAFDCAREWADKYRVEMGAEPPVPAYWAGYYTGSNPGGFADSMVDSFQATIASSISSYAATQRSSSSGGVGGD